MNTLPVLVAALALVVPAPRAAFAPQAETVHEAAPRSVPSDFAPALAEPDAYRNFRDDVRPEVQHQMHIEQHVMIRITPSPPSMRREMFAEPPEADEPVHYKEKKFDKCIPIDGIVGITPMEPNRLVLFMRDHHMLSASLERACDADAFYLGAYVERSADGKLCTGRDILRARTGATCRLSKINRLVAVKD